MWHLAPQFRWSLVLVPTQLTIHIRRTIHNAHNTHTTTVIAMLNSTSMGLIAVCTTTPAGTGKPMTSLRRVNYPLRWRMSIHLCTCRRHHLLIICIWIRSYTHWHPRSYRAIARCTRVINTIRTGQGRVRVPPRVSKAQDRKKNVVVTLWKGEDLLPSLSLRRNADFVIGASTWSQWGRTIVGVVELWVVSITSLWRY